MDGKLTVRGFTDAVHGLQRQLGVKVLSSLGLSTRNITGIFLFLFFFLILVCVFIFLGIAGFSNSTQFQSVVNSLLPLAATLGFGQAGVGDFDTLVKRAEDEIPKFFEKLKRVM